MHDACRRTACRPPRRRGSSSRCSERVEHPRVDRVEAWRPAAGRTARTPASTCATPDDHVALGVDAVEPVVLADEPVPVVAALRVVLADADDAPRQRDLLGPVRVGAQRPARGSARRRCSVVAVVRSTRPVTARASQPSPSRPRVPTSTLHVALLEEPRHPRHPVAAGPAALEPRRRRRRAALPGRARTSRRTPGAPSASPSTRPRSGR